MAENNNSTLVIYADMVSQPSRAVISFCRLNQIPFALKLIAVRKLEHVGIEFTKINPA